MFSRGLTCPGLNLGAVGLLCSVSHLKSCCAVVCFCQAELYCVSFEYTGLEAPSKPHLGQASRFRGQHWCIGLSAELRKLSLSPGFGVSELGFRMLFLDLKSLGFWLPKQGVSGLALRGFQLVGVKLHGRRARQLLWPFAAKRNMTVDARATRLVMAQTLRVQVPKYNLRWPYRLPDVAPVCRIYRLRACLGIASRF